MHSFSDVHCEKGRQGVLLSPFICPHRDAISDIDKMAKILVNKSAAAFLSERNSPTFEDPTERGLKKLCNTEWVHSTLARTPLDEDPEEEHIVDLVRNSRCNIVNLEFFLFYWNKQFCCLLFI